MTEIQHLNKYFQEAVIQAVPCAVFVVDENERPSPLIFVH